MAGKRKYGSYVNLYKRLKRDGITPPGPVATLLLDTFVVRLGTLREEHCIEAGVLGDSTFADFRRKLEKFGWILYDKNLAIQTKRYAFHQAGPNLVAMVNKEQAKSEPMATLRHLDQKVDKEDFENLRNEVAELKEGYRGIIEILDPPGDDVKVAYYAKNPRAMMRLVAGEKPNS